MRENITKRYIQHTKGFICTARRHKPLPLSCWSELEFDLAPEQNKLQQSVLFIQLHKERPVIP